MQVAEVMTTTVVTAPADATMRAAARHMLAEGVGSVVVTRDGNPAGILTEHDFVVAARDHDRPFSEVPVYAVASRPLVTTEPSASVRRAAEEMRDAGVRRLPVADGLDLVGIVAATDLLEVREALDEEHRAALRERHDWTGDAPDSVD